MKCILFVCTGNYYRSRFAESVFNHLAPTMAPGWAAVSRGIAVEACKAVNLGSMSRRALAALDERGIEAPGALRMPCQIDEDDCARADLIIAMKSEEHRAYLQERHALHRERMRFWIIHDQDPGPDYDPLAEIETLVKSLLVELSASP